MNAEEAIRNLRIMSDSIAEMANKPSVYNTDYAHYLEQFSYQLHRDANELAEIVYHYEVY